MDASCPVMSGRFLEFTAVLLNMFGYTEEEILGQNYVDITPARCHSVEARNVNQRSFRAKTQTSSRKSTGRSTATRAPGVPHVLLKDGTGRSSGMWAIIRDISERKRTEEAIASSNELLQAIINTAPMSVFWKDTELRYMGCNIAFARDAGAKSPDDLIGKDNLQFRWKGQTKSYRSDDLQVIESGIPHLSYDELLTTPDGRRYRSACRKCRFVMSLMKLSEFSAYMMISPIANERKMCWKRVKKNIAASLSSSMPFLITFRTELCNPLRTSGSSGPTGP